MSKFRLSFVTNSSSSCFILGKNKSCTVAEIKDALLQEKNLRDLYEDNILYIQEDHGVNTYEDFLNDFAKYLCDIASGVQMGDWELDSFVFSSDPVDEVYDTIIYYIGSVETPNFKLESRW